jgi:hypothetical protein
MQQPLTCFERLPVISRDQLPIKRKINDIFELIGEEFRCSPNRNLIAHLTEILLLSHAVGTLKFTVFFFGGLVNLFMIIRIEFPVEIIVQL